MKYHPIKHVCPYCGSAPVINKDPLWRSDNGTTHGYYNCHDFSVGCPNTDCPVRPQTREYDTIYEKDEDVQIMKAIKDWDTRYVEG